MAEQEFKCERCGVSFPNQEELQKHNTEQHGA